MKWNRTQGVPEKGKRVIVTGGAWAGFSGAYVGEEATLTGVLHKVELDNGFSTLVPIYQIRIVPEAE